MYTITTQSGRTFDADANETLLDAALRQGVVFNHSCRNGRCNACKARVLCGDTTALHDETGLSAEERSQGHILTCVRLPRSAVTLQANDLGDIRLPPPVTLPCRIQSLELLAPDVMGVTLRLPPQRVLDFLPGQYIDVIGADGLRRSYSIANAPRTDGRLELHIRAVAGGEMSRYWFEQAQPNDLLRLRGPLGTFFLRDQAGKHVALLATGTGIAPVKAMLEGLTQLPPDGLPRQVRVYWGGRRPADLYWQAPAHMNVRIVPVLSLADGDWLGARGHVQDALLQEIAPDSDWSQMRVYACGSDAMIHSAQALLCAAGLPAHHFHADAFVCSAAT